MFKQTVWPYDDEAAKRIACYVKRMRVDADTPSGQAMRNVYVWRDGNAGPWQYTVQGELTGMTDTHDLNEAMRQVESKVRPHV